MLVLQSRSYGRSSDMSAVFRYLFVMKFLALKSLKKSATEVEGTCGHPDFRVVIANI